ncbi:tyrosine-type recombinase/integrase [Paraglaciecola polaris]|uniref:Tyr recombinase domain-containing protein n=1 Tax=Paraglaciecola polaris LMG 21857 TaxID=1129793 RepID=K6ZPW5_9ALTE|nr:tyrosine-type recombinase/integrase [Paraglaciecola polaris]GAC32307.1 hypothetical protein GPLA_1393 [Paraglaciecola polaris LMG 21857]
MSNVINLIHSDETEQEESITLYPEVEVKPRRDNDFPIVLIKGRGKLHKHANGCLLARHYHPTFFDSELEQTTPVTINNYADHIRQWLNTCALLKTSYLYADYNFLLTVLNTLRDSGLQENSLANYITTWRLFYEYLDVLNVPHRMDLPKKIKKKRILSDAENQGDYLNYTRKDNTAKVTVDPLIDQGRIIKRSSYISQVLSKSQMKELISELRKNDVVYGVMAKVQFDTLLRITELIDYFPHTSNALNPNFKCWGEMHIGNLQEQEFNFIGKGQYQRNISLDIRTLKLIEDKLITAKRTGSDTPIYDERKHKFLTKYLETKDGKKSRYEANTDVLWLTENGHPVSKGMFQQAFRDASMILKEKGIIPSHIHVRSHAMRHTGATLRLVKYKKETGVDIHTDNDGDIHAFLQNLLGHTSMSTTHRYIRTVRDKTFSNLAAKTIIRNEELWDEEIKNNSTLKKGVDAIKSEL